MKTKLLLLLVLVPALLQGCGPGKALQPLHGETPAIATMLETQPEVLQSSAPYQSANTLLSSVREGQVMTIIPQLSKGTHAGLIEAVKTPGQENMTIEGALQALVTTPDRLEKVLFGFSGTTIGIPTPREMSKGQMIPHEHRANVRILSSSKTEHWAIFVFEDGAWKLHQTEFDQIL